MMIRLTVETGREISLGVTFEFKIIQKVQYSIKPLFDCNILDFRRKVHADLDRALDQLLEENK